ncbi:MAG: hypothetical protein J7K30_06915 [Deltaproteobacteria bacterium]|nr:hypothetical protein [Deltaproteobacteria bacterium]
MKKVVILVLIFVFSSTGIIFAQPQGKGKGYQNKKESMAINDLEKKSMNESIKERERFEGKQKELEKKQKEKKREEERLNEEGDRIGEFEKGKQGRSEAAHQESIDKGKKEGKKDKGKAWWKLW